MNKIKNILITTAGLTIILSAAVIFSIPPAETRFDIRVKREDRIVFPGEPLIYSEFSHVDFNGGENSGTFHKSLIFKDNNDNSGRLLVYIHSIQTFTKFSFISELLEIEIKVRQRGNTGADYFVDAYLIENIGSGRLLEKELDLAGRNMTLLIERNSIRTEDNYVPVTTVQILHGANEPEPLHLLQSKVYKWREEPKTPQLAEYGENAETYSVREKFRGDLF